MVRSLDLQLRYSGFNSQPFHFHIMTLCKPLTHMPLSPRSIIWYWPKVCGTLQWEGNLAESDGNLSLGLCSLQADCVETRVISSPIAHIQYGSAFTFTSLRCVVEYLLLP